MRRLFRCPSCGRSGIIGSADFVRCGCKAKYRGEELLPHVQEIHDEEMRIDLPCSHRGEIVDRVDCGCDGNANVYECEIHGQCLVRQLIQSRWQGVVCAGCKSRRHPVEDLVIITTHYNPAGFQRLRDTYRHWVKTMPPGVVTIELAGSDPDIPEAVHVYGGHDSILWQKERLINYALTLLKPSVRFVAWVDHDLIFQRGDWAQAGVEAILSGLDCVQLFDRVDYLDCDGNAISHQPGAVAQIQAGRGPSGAPGGAWMASREWLASIGGLYDRNIAGGGDATFLEAVTGAATSFSERQAPRLWEDCRRYVEHVGGAKFGHVAGAVKHLWHGDRSNRQYISRDEILCRWDFDPQSMIEHDDGPWRWTEAAPAGLQVEIANYFANRREDG